MRAVLHILDSGVVAITYPVDHDVETIADRLKDPIIIETSDLPSDRTFRNAWKPNGDLVIVDLNGAKEICHTKRREVRAAEFAPWDIKATIPAEADHAEKQRQAIRVKYAAIQENIDAAEDVSLLGSIHTAL
jgi:hypothetical protein